MKQEYGTGTVRTVKRRGRIVGYQALLPRDRSTPPLECKNPRTYREPIGRPQPTREEAQRLLNAALVELRDKPTLKHGLPVSHYVQASIKAQYQDARRRYANDARASKHVATWRSVEKLWLPKASWFEWPPSAVEPADVQKFFDWLRDEAEGSKGDPLSGSFIRTIASVARAAFERSGIQPNPTLGLKLPRKDAPRVTYLELSAQRRLFGAEDDKISLADRVRVGCGMGAGLRVGELLSFEIEDVHVDDHDPYLIVRYGGPHHAPPKGKRTRRVELFEPGLGFWRLWMYRFYQGGRLVFAGPKGGYEKAWPERFPGWATVTNVDRLSSHIMRHTYAVACLSGTWGYEPRTLEFVSQQLGHAELTTTQRYYGAFEHGVWQREVRRMTGRSGRALTPITAENLLGDLGANWRIMPGFLAHQSQMGVFPSSTQTGLSSEETASDGAIELQSLDAQAADFLERAAEGDLTALSAGIQFARAYRAHRRAESEQDDQVADVGLFRSGGDR